MSKLWFKQKTYGWGWEPANWQGWLVMLVYILLTAAYPLFCYFKKTELNILIFFLIINFLTIGLIMLAYKKGEKPQWRWGKKPK